MNRHLGTRVLFVLTTVVLLGASGCSVTKWGRQVGTLPNEKGISRAQTEESLDSAIKTNREQALLVAAESRWGDGDPADCEMLLRRILESNPESRDAQRMLAELHLATGRPHLALNAFEQLLSSEPNSLELQCQYAVALEEVGRDDEADALFQRIASSAKPDSWLAATSYRSVTPRHMPRGVVDYPMGPAFRDARAASGIVPANFMNDRANFSR